VLRVFRDTADVGRLTRQQALLAALHGRVAVPTPVIETIDGGGRYTIETRLPGRSMLRRLRTLTGEARRTAIANFIAVASKIGAFSLPDRPYGHLLADRPIHSATWTEFLRLSLDHAIAANHEVIAGEVGDVGKLRSRALTLLADVPDEPGKGLVHGDYFPGNVLLDDALAVCGVVDFSDYTLVGDPLYDALTAPIFLEMIEETNANDRAYANTVVAGKHSDALPRARFYRAHAAFWMADPAYGLPPYPRLYPWAIANLKRLATNGY